MANHHSLHHLLHFLIALSTINVRLISSTQSSAPPPSPPTIPPPPPPPPFPSDILPPPISSPTMPLPSPPIIISPPSPLATKAELQEHQLNNIIDALIGAGDFAGWANILSAIDPSTLPLTATFFIPGDGDISHLHNATSATNFVNFDPFVIIPYHIIPQRLSFSDLQLLPTHTRLPTLLPSKTILITNNSSSNFTIDNSPIIFPDIYVTSAVAVHGVGAILDYTIYGDGLFSPPHPTPRPAPPEVVAPPYYPTGEEVIGRGRSDAACLCTEFPIVFSVVCAAFVFKIQRNPLTR